MALFSAHFAEAASHDALGPGRQTLPSWGRRLRRIFAFFIFSSCLASILLLPTAADSGEKRHILVLNSYHKGMSWTDNIERGLVSVLGNEGWNIELHFEYMDAKRYHGKRYLQKLHETFLEKYRGEHFDVVIAADNDAFDFIRRHRRELFPYTPVVFCGVNDYDDSMIAGLDYITGVVEDTDVKGTIEVALRLHPKMRQIVVLGDMTTTGMFEALRADAGAGQQTDVVTVNADLLEVATEGGRHWASVRFSGLVRETPGAEPASFEEVWNLMKPADGSSGWLLAGIQQMH